MYMYNDYAIYPSQESPDARSIRAQERKAKSNCEAVMAFENAMFNWKSRYQILVLTLGYTREWAPFITFEDMRRDRDHLFNNMRSSPLLRRIDGYVWKLEEGGFHAGHHMHLVIFYDRDSHGDISAAEAIGKYWVNVITLDGQGAFTNCNKNKEKYERGQWGNATGQVDRHDAVKRASLQAFLGKYLAKDDQHVVARMGTRYRTFGTSQAPA